MSAHHSESSKDIKVEPKVSASILQLLKVKTSKEKQSTEKSKPKKDIDLKYLVGEWAETGQCQSVKYLITTDKQYLLLKKKHGKQNIEQHTMKNRKLMSLRIWGY